ncbi:MAG: AEC family transporter [Aquisalimonadaceae bacterium]
MSLIATIINILAPVTLIIALGWALVRTGFLSARALHDMNRLTYWVGLPSLLVYRTAASSPEIGTMGGVLIVGFATTLIGALAAVIVARVLAIPLESRSTFVLGVFRGNLIFVGLPIVLYAFSGLGEAAAGVESSLLLVFGPMVVLYNVMAVLVLLHGGGVKRNDALSAAMRGLMTNPILIACIVGLTLSWTATELPMLAERTLSAIGQMALPLALICIGGTLHTTRVHGSLRWAVVGSLMKLLLLPAVGYLLAVQLGLTAEHTLLLLILMACPSATASYVLVRQMGGDEPLASGTILVSHLLAIPAMIVVLVVAI